MILDWLIYLVVTSAGIGAAALMAERALHGRGGARFVWFAALLISLLLPFAVDHLAWQGRVPRSPVASITETNDAASKAFPATTPAVPAATDETLLTRTVVGAWASATFALWLFVAAHLVWIAHRRRHLTRGRVNGSDVYFDRDIGPAVMGFARPMIVLPDWFHDLARVHQDAIVLHERAHVAARDTQLMFVAFLIAAAVPWNPVLWWQFVRLRRAIELDCDGRVLRAVGTRDYGEALLAIARRRSEPMRFAVPVLRARSFLERRIAAMSQRNRKASILVTSGLVVGSMGLVSAAAQVSQPHGAFVLEQAQLIRIGTSTLDRYVGAYRFADATVIWIARAGDHLQARFTGQSAADIYPQGQATFFYASPDVDARIEFVATEEGAATEAILRQNGAVTHMPRIEPSVAAQIEGALEQRVSTQTADPRSQAALRDLVEGVIAGRVDRDHVNAQLAAALAKDLPKLQLRLASLGKPVSYQFKSVGRTGIDEYEVTHERGVSEWGILVDSKDVITSATVP